VTKKSIDFFQRLHTFDEYYHIRSLKDKRFIPDIEEIKDSENENDQNNPREDVEESESSMSVESESECDELPETIKLEAYQSYEETRKTLLFSPPS